MNTRSLAGFALGACLGAAGASAPAEVSPSPFAPLASDAAGHGVTEGKSAQMRIQLQGGNGDAGTLVPGADSLLLIHGRCLGADGCFGTLNYAFDPKVVMVFAALGAAASCTVTGKANVSCAVELGPGEPSSMTARLRFDPYARGESYVMVTAAGNFYVDDPMISLTLTPRAKVRIMQTPDPTLVVNGAHEALVTTQVLVRNEGPSGLNAFEVTETFSASPKLQVALGPESRGKCKGTGPINCVFGRFGPDETRRYSFQASLSSQVPTSMSEAQITPSGDFYVGAPASFRFVHVGREYIGLMEFPDTIVRGQPFDASVGFFNLVPKAAGNDVIPLGWTFDGGRDLEVVDFDAKAPLLICTRGPGAHQVSCATPDISSEHSGGNATLTLRALRSGLLKGVLSWSAAPWGSFDQTYTWSVDEPASR